MQKLPVGIQTFRKIIEGDYLYIDKTGLAFDLIENNQYIFLSRPRRFGKSLLLDTLHNIFSGNRELFEGLDIYERWDWGVKYPVIKISFSGSVHSKEGLDQFLFSVIDRLKKELKIECATTENANFCFGELIRSAYEKYSQRVVILIDEYDKPILDNLDNIEVASILRDGLCDFYSQIKDNDRYLRFAFLTGVSKFTKTSIFSGLNNITDVSLNPRYGNICGYTQNDLETVFEKYFYDVDMDKLKLWYNGYNFLGDSVYNPYGILQFLQNDKVYKNYWFESGTPSFLIDLIEKNRYYVPNFENILTDESMVSSFDIEELSLETIMFQSGYLTINEMLHKRNRIQYKLGFPNIEVKMSFLDYLLNKFVDVVKKNPIADELYDIFETGSIDKLEKVLKSLFASIAYNNFTKNEIQNYEGFYASVIYAYFASLGLDIIAEDVTNYGRIDLTLKFGNRVYIFEFKMVDEDPLKQIKERGYFEKYSSAQHGTGVSVEIYIVGIVFDRDERNITQFKWEKVE